MENLRLGIIGAGAAGMTAAIAAASLGAPVTLVEKNDRAGKKILMTGNGKCNLSNRSLSVRDYYSSHPKLLSGFLDQFGTEDTVAFFEGLGLFIKDKGGYLYPLSEQASGVLDVLRFACGRAGVKLQTGAEVTSIQKKKDFTVTTAIGDYHFDKLILACGGLACPKSGSDGMGYRLAAQMGHSLIPAVPALVQLRCQEKYLKEIAGVRCQAAVSLYVRDELCRQESGELQLTDYGISGIPVFQLSRTAAYALKDRKKVTAILDFMPDYATEDLMDRMKIKYGAFAPNSPAEEFFTGILNKKIMRLVMKQAGIRADSPMGQTAWEQVRQTIFSIKSFRVTVIDTNHFENAQVSAGGVPLNEVTRCLESVFVPGLYFAGELLDVDGRCGGYNLQWAWTSGHIAGCAAAGGSVS